MPCITKNVETKRKENIQSTQFHYGRIKTATKTIGGTHRQSTAVETKC